MPPPGHLGTSQWSMVATKLATDGKSPAALADVVYPAARMQVLGPAGTDPLALFKGAFDIRAHLAIPADAPPGPRKIPLVLTLQACDASSCKAPIEIRLDLSLRFDADDGAAQHPPLFPGKK